jgi:Tfp pilus assembly protein FimT
LELVIVLSVIGLIAGLSWPMLMRPWSKSRVQQAAQDLSRELLRTRLQAIERGQTFQLRWRPGTGEFAIHPWQPPGPEIVLLGDEPNLYSQSSNQQPSNAAAKTPSDLDSTTTTTTAADLLTENDEQQPSAADRLQLIDGVVFIDPLQSTESPFTDETSSSAATRPFEDLSSTDRNPTRDPARDELSPGLESTTTWSPPVWFYPDGRTTNARWTLVGADGFQIDVTLRGWVGSVRVGPVQERSVPDTELVDGGPEMPTGDPGRAMLEP